MARLFSGSGQYLTATDTPASLPVTMACWFYAHSVSRNDFLITIAEDGPIPATKDFLGLRLRGGVGGDPVRAISWNASGSGAASTSTGFSTNTWHHGCAVFAADDDRRVYIDGGSKGTNVTNTATAMQRTNIACMRREGLVSDEHDGGIAETVIYEGILSDEEVAMLALGYSPLLIQPQNIFTYVPFIRDADNDIVGTLDFLTVGVPTVMSHPRVFYPKK